MSVVVANVLDLHNVIVEEATAVFVYLLPKGLECVRNVLDMVRRKPNGRVVSYLFSIPGWEATEVVHEGSKGNFPVYFYDSYSSSLSTMSS